MNFGEIYCESWFGLRNALNSWGIIYPSCGIGFTADSTLFSTDTTLYTTDRTVT